MKINKSKLAEVAGSIKNSRPLVRSETRIAKAVSWRLGAFQTEPNLMNLVRPIIQVPASTGPSHAVSPRKHQGKSDFSQHRFRWGGEFYDKEVRENVVFYESFSGNGALCNPFAVFEYLLHDPSMQHLEHVWSIKDGEERKRFNTEYARYRNVRAVKTESVTYWSELSTAKYLLNNATFPPYFSKRSAQVYINLWHGTPLKKMGYHSNEGATGARNILRNFVQADYLVSPNRFTSSTMFRDAYKLDGFFKGKIIEQGYPRIDAQFRDHSESSLLASGFRDVGIVLDDRKVVLYAPTWKGESFHNPTNDVKELLQRVNYLNDEIGSRYQVLLKVHQQVYKYAKNLPEFEGYLIPNSIPTNEVLGITDVLVTDYSSIYFDFLATKQPIIFLAPDFANYEGLRGMYHDSLPGPVVSQVDQVAELLSEYGGTSDGSKLDDYSLARHEAAAEFCNMDDGNATKRVVDIVFKSNPDDLELVSMSGTNKRKILLYLGGMRNNGITTSALNLLNNLDFDRFDVSIWAPQPSKDSPEFLYERIPSEVRQFLRQGSHPLTQERFDQLNKFLESPDFDDAVIPESVRQVFETEWRRCFGQSEFDYIVDFSGYAGFWSFVLLQGHASESFSVWQHNDLSSDRDREVNGKRPNFLPLSSQFNAYRFFDNLVSVSEDLRAINEDKLSGYAHRNAFKACHNTIDSRKVKDALSGRNSTLVLDKADEVRSAEDVIDLLLGHNTGDQIRELLAERELHSRIFKNTGVTRFVNAGRMSPEKNHARLLRSFAIVHAKNPDTELVLLGDGALRKPLEAMADELGIGDAVVFAGMVKNALPIMRDCDCFVLSSDYEGQPMVILEASSLGIPVVSVAFASVRNSLDSSRGIVVDQDEESLAHGMLQYLAGEVVEHVLFDVDEYNQKVMREFYSAIGADA